jgi:hypothetical protein
VKKAAVQLSNTTTTTAVRKEGIICTLIYRPLHHPLSARIQFYSLLGKYHKHIRTM